MTKTEIRRLVRVTRGLGHFASTAKPHRAEFVCPVHHEALQAAYRRGTAHRFMVEVLPWEDPSTVGAVTAALTEHLAAADDNGEPCGRLS